KAAVECRRGRLHVRADHSLLEVLDSAGQPVEPGELGRVHVTTLASRIMPLVRYQLGDVGRLLPERCDCEAADWPCFELHGRAKDALCLSGRIFTTRQVDDAVGVPEGLELWSLHQHSDRGVTLKWIPRPGAGLDHAGLKSRLAHALGGVEVRL